MKWLGDHESHGVGRRNCGLYAGCFTAPIFAWRGRRQRRKTIKISINRPKFDLTSSEALTPQHHRKILGCGKQLKFSESLLPLITNLLSYYISFQSVKIK